MAMTKMMPKKPICFDGYHLDNIESFHAMQEAGIKIVILKVSQGSIYDSAFPSFSARARSIGLVIGGYHFGVNGDGTRQADLFLARLKKGDLMVLDFEPFPKSQMTYQQAVDFVNRVKEKTGRLPMLYYGHMLIEMDTDGKIPANSVLRQCKAWISRYGPQQPTPIKDSDMVLWQYTGDGEGPEPHRVPGCTNNADLSVWIGNEADIPRFVEKYGFPG